MQKKGLAPVVDEKSRILILGTLPGDKSLRTRQYYADSSNQFWEILSSIYNEKIDANYYSRLCILSNKRIALWDVLKSAKRVGSLDSAIEEETPNDFSSLFERYPQIEAIGFNGVNAQMLFRKYCMSAICSAVENKMRMKAIASTSSSYKLPLKQKVLEWKKFMSVT